MFIVSVFRFEYILRGKNIGREMVGPLFHCGLMSNNRMAPFLVVCYATLHTAMSVRRLVGRSVGRLVNWLVPFLGSGPKGPMSCRTQGRISRRPSVCTSVHRYVHPSIPPEAPLRPHISPLRPLFTPLHQLIIPSRASGTADHVQSLDN